VISKSNDISNYVFDILISWQFYTAKALFYSE